MAPVSGRADTDPRGEFWRRSSRETRCLRSILAFSSSGRSSKRLGSPPVFTGVAGLRAVMPPTETLREDGPSPEGKLPAKPSPLGVPYGVWEDLGGMLGGGGVPVNCARSCRALGDPDMLGLSLANSAGVCRGLCMFMGCDEPGCFLDMSGKKRKEYGQVTGQELWVKRERTKGCWSDHGGDFGVCRGESAARGGHVAWAPNNHGSSAARLANSDQHFHSTLNFHRCCCVQRCCRRGWRLLVHQVMLVSPAHPFSPHLPPQLTGTTWTATA